MGSVLVNCDDGMAVLNQLAPFAEEGLELSVSSHSHAVGVTVGGQIDELKRRINRRSKPQGSLRSGTCCSQAVVPVYAGSTSTGTTSPAATLYGWCTSGLPDEAVAIGSRCFRSAQPSVSYYFDLRLQVRTSTTAFALGLAKRVAFADPALELLRQLVDSVPLSSHIHFASYTAERLPRVRIFLARPPATLVRSIVEVATGQDDWNRVKRFLKATGGSVGYFQVWASRDSRVGWRLYAGAFPSSDPLKWVIKVLHACGPRTY